MQTRSSSASSVTTGATKKQYSPEEIDIIMKKMHEKEQLLKEQSEDLQVKQERLRRAQEELEQREFTEDSAGMEQVISSLHKIADQIERINSRITNLEISTQDTRHDRLETQTNPQLSPHKFDAMDQPSPIRLKDAIDDAVSNRAVSNRAVSNRACRIVRYPIVRCPIVRCPMLQCPIVQCTCPIVQCPMLPCPIVQCACPIVQCRIVRCPIERCPIVTCPKGGHPLRRNISISVDLPRAEFVFVRI